MIIRQQTCLFVYITNTETFFDGGGGGGDGGGYDVDDADDDDDACCFVAVCFPLLSSPSGGEAH